MSVSLPVVKGTLDVLMLKALSQTPMHGFEVVSWLEAHSRAGLEVEDSAIYQGLYRMEKRGLVVAEWGVTENNRRARYYRISASGRAQLRSQTTEWLRYTKMVTAILTASPSVA